MKLQVLSIGEVTSGKSQATGREWHRRIFQVFCIDSQVAGNVPVYGDLEKLASYKQGGVYNADVNASAGNNGKIELQISNLEPQTKTV